MSHFTVAVITEKGTEQEVDKLLAPYQENNMGDCPQEYLEFNEDDDCDIDEQTGKKGYWENPNRKWDWYKIGGRWSGLLKLKTGEKINVAQIKDIDLSLDQAAYDEAIRFWEVIVEGLPKQEGEEFHSFWKPEYYVETYGTKEKYAMDVAEFSTFAMVLPDGKWTEKGEMGWFGIDDSTSESRQEYKQTFKEILETKSDYYITIVDCHI
ncbi:hypothetical protein [Enterococcus sp. AZ192]|uniref:hypothetical protein n=1 Tax=unclassified Enterococcus TaxID=2608891 RepID=UPI003D269207